MATRKTKLTDNLLRSFRNNVVTGTLVLAPFGAVLWIILWLWNIVVAFVNLIPHSLHPTVFLEIENGYAIAALDFATTLFIIFIFAVGVWIIGLVSRHYIGSRVLAAFSQLVNRVPVLRTVYSTLEQLLKTFGSGQAKNFRRVVQIEYPRQGLYALAFVTGERGDMLNIYVPTTPNPTSGFYLSVPATQVKEMKMSVEDALKEIISMGLVHKDG